MAPPYSLSLRLRVWVFSLFPPEFVQCPVLPVRFVLSLLNPSFLFYSSYLHTGLDPHYFSPELLYQPPDGVPCLCCMSYIHRHQNRFDCVPGSTLFNGFPGLQRTPTSFGIQCLSWLNLLHHLCFHRCSPALLFPPAKLLVIQLLLLRIPFLSVSSCQNPILTVRLRPNTISPSKKAVLLPFPGPVQKASLFLLFEHSVSFSWPSSRTGLLCSMWFIFPDRCWV